MNNSSVAANTSTSATSSPAKPRRNSPTKGCATTSKPSRATPQALHTSFAFYRALDTTIAQNEKRKEQPLTLPVLAIAGEANSGDLVANTMKLAATHVESLIIPDCGHYPAEEAPEAMPDALTRFLAPYRDGVPSEHTPRQHTSTRQEHTSEASPDDTTPTATPPTSCSTGRTAKAQ
jgi:hypothetical protein